MRILFISHSFPPTLGGVETQNFNLSKGLAEITKVKIIANGKGKKWLPIFIPLTTLQALFLMKKYDVCLLGNGVLAPVGSFLKLFHGKKPFFCVVHGLDITFANRKGFLSRVYRIINIPALKKLTKLFMVGNTTIEEAVKIGIDQQHCVFIPNGVNPDELVERHTRKELSELFGKNTENKKVILRLGRFVPHKGTAWFIRNVVPSLPENHVLVAAGNRVPKNTAGDKDDFLECEKAILELGLQNKVCLLPSLPWKLVLSLYNTVDLVVSPNIKIPGTMEGFGINVIEAGACGRMVVASNLEGLADAIKEGENGFLVESGNTQAWVQKITQLTNLLPEQRKEIEIRTANFVRENYSWEKICRKYYEEMKKYCN